MPDDIEPQLIVKREPIVKPISGPGVFWLLIVIALVFMALAVVIFGNQNHDGNAVISSGVTATPIATDTHQTRIYTVSYKNSVFSPTNLRIHAGDTVRFRNDDIFAIRIISDPPEDLAGFDSVGEIPQGSYFSFTFAAKGTFGYTNASNNKETGTIIVR